MFLFIRVKNMKGHCTQIKHKNKSTLPVINDKNQRKYKKRQTKTLYIVYTFFCIKKYLKRYKQNISFTSLMDCES